MSREVEKILEEREKEYGPFDRMTENIANLWSEWFRDNDGCVFPSDVAVLMILFKLCRIKETGGTRDTWNDIIGYATLERDRQYGEHSEGM